MADKAPLIFEPRLGGLFPVNTSAIAAMSGVQGRVNLTITGGRANQRRRGLYWILVGIVTPIMNDMHGLTLTDDDMHDLMRDKFKMFTLIDLPSGDVHKKRWSTSNRAMSEADRSVYLTKCLDVWGRWIGVDPMTLQREAEAV